MRVVDFPSIIQKAWDSYDPSQSILSISDISARVSTNHVFKVTFPGKQFIIAKLSYFGTYEHFKEDHAIINILARELPSPYENFLARSLVKDNEVYTYRYQDDIIDAWVVFYKPVKTMQKPPRKLDREQIMKLGVQLATFHKACSSIKEKLPPSSKTLRTDIDHLLAVMNTETGKYEHRGHDSNIRRQCASFLHHTAELNYDEFEIIPVFVDWNIGNFSVNENFELYSRWDYDWFRVSSRVVDFYFLSRVVSHIGDRTIFSYKIDPLMEDRFILFLKHYHQTFPLTEAEVRFMKEAYRFFILNYVIKDGRYFFHEIYATRLQKEAYTEYLPLIDYNFKPEKILKALKI